MDLSSGVDGTDGFRHASFAAIRFRKFIDTAQELTSSRSSEPSAKPVKMKQRPARGRPEDREPGGWLGIRKSIGIELQMTLQHQLPPLTMNF